MDLRNRRGFGALVVLLAVLLGAIALPMLTLGASNQITGVVSDSISGSPVSGALVTLTDANGYYPPQKATTGGDGVYAFSPGSGSYTLMASASGYFAKGAGPIRFDGQSTVSQNFSLDPTPPLNKVAQLTVVNDLTSTPISGAVVEAYYAPALQVVASGTSSVTGQVNLTLFTATFELRTNATGFITNVVALDTSSTTTLTIRLQIGNIVQGHARSTSGNFLSDGLVGFLYDPNTATAKSSPFKVIRAAVTGSFYQFHVPAGVTYDMVIDANGYRAYTTTVTTIAGTLTRDATLAVSDPEKYATTIVYGSNDWSNLTIYRNTTLNPDSNLTTLNPRGLRDLRLQIDYSLGNANGVIDGTEATTFHNWLVANGPFYVTTDGNFTTNGKSYLSSAVSYSVNVAGLTTPGSKVWINTSATYALKQAPPYVALRAKTYSVNLTLLADRNISVLQDYVYTIAFPRAYELNTSSIVPSAPVEIEAFAPAVINPGVTSLTPQIRMSVTQSLTGTARARVVAPAGKFFVQNATDSNYQAFVAANASLTFSAETTTDPNDHVTDANFTWRFTPSATGYGIRPVYTYTQHGQFLVNLTVRETGGNLTYRTITIWADDQVPVASIRTNRTGSTSANGLTLKVDEGIQVRFDGGLSTDLAYPGKTNPIPNSGYSWDFNGDHIADATGRIQNYTFPKPGQFKVNLTVTDSVGWKSTNATMTAIVNDTKAPVPGFDILDPSKDWGTITSPTELKTYAFNASKTTDDYSKVTYNATPGLNFTWKVPGPIVGLTGTNHTFYGINITFAWKEWNVSYSVLLSVKDTGFGSGKPNTGNATRSIQVQIDVSLHADLSIVAGTMKVNPPDPEEGAPITVTVNVTNKANRARAGNVTTQLLAITNGVTTIVTSQADWLDKNGNPKPNQTIAAGEIVLFVFGVYARRKIKAGEWRPLRGRRQKGGEEKEKPRKEVKEEKKRL